MLAHQPKKALLPLRAFAACFREARRNDDQRADPGPERFFSRVEHQLPGRQMTARSTASAISPTAP